MGAHNRLWLLRGLPLFAAVFCLFSPVFAMAQGFMVKPMKMEIAARTGETTEVALELQNTSAEGAKTLDLSLVELAQAPSGAWVILEGEAATKQADSEPNPANCIKWLSLSASTVNVDPVKAETVQVKVKVPPRASGTYYAGVIAQTRPPAGATGLKIVVRFLIPVIVEIQGRPERQKINFNDLEMAISPKTEGKPLGTTLLAKIDNDGRTYSRIKGNVKLTYQTHGHWQTVGTSDIREVGILPGSKLALPSELTRGLPSGKYKLLGTVFVDGRRLKPIEKEIDFTGDPSVTKLTVDTALMVDPAEIVVAGAPGAVRTASVKIENTSDEAVEVVAATAVPPPLRGVALGETKGDDFSCAAWMEMNPAKFTLRPGGKQSLRLTAKTPADAQAIAAYFATLSLHATYPDGQSAGETQALVIVENKKVEPKPQAQVMKVTLAAGEANQYIVQTRLGNTGNCRFMPRGLVSVIGDGGKPAVEASISGTDTDMLPLETRDGSSVLDFEKVDPGSYILKVGVDCGTGQGAFEQLSIRVSVEDGQKVVTVITPEATSSSAPATGPAGNGK